MRIKKGPRARELEGLARELLGELRELSESTPRLNAGISQSGAAQRELLGGFTEAAESAATAGFGLDTGEDVLLKAAAMEAGATQTREPFYDADWTPVRGRGDYREKLLAQSGRAPRLAGRGRDAARADETGVKDVQTTRSVRAETAESLSEAICRDARRYDGAFEKY